MSRPENPTSSASRRAMLAAGVWGAPAIVVASAVPAWAGTAGTQPLVSVPTVSTALSQETVQGVLRNYLDITCSLVNEGEQSTTALVVDVDVEPTTGDYERLVAYDYDTQIWDWTQSTVTGAGFRARFVRLPPHLGATPDSVTLFFRVRMTTPTSEGTLRITPSPSPGVGVPQEATWPTLA